MTRTLLHLLLALAWAAVLDGTLQAAHAVDPAKARTNPATQQTLERAARESHSEKIAVGRERYENRQAYRRALVASLNEQAAAAHARSSQDLAPGAAASPEPPSTSTGLTVMIVLGSAVALGLIHLQRRRRRR